MRRRLLKVVGAFFLGGLIPPVAFASAAPELSERQAFAAFVDVLLPQDALSPSASALGVDGQLWQLAESDPRFMQLLTLGCRWLNMTEQVNGFAGLTGAQQITLVGWMAESDRQQIPRRFYELMRQAVLEVYFSHAQALAGLPLHSAPQPLGYLPPWA